MPGVQKKSWVVTWNNPPFAGTDGDIDAKLLDFMESKLQEREFTYAVWQLERGRENTLHAQMYVQFDKKVRTGGVRRLFPGCYAEARRGTHEEAVAYSQKEDTRVEGLDHHELGEAHREGSGRRTDLEDVCINLWPQYRTFASAV